MAPQPTSPKTSGIPTLIELPSTRASESDWLAIIFEEVELAGSPVWCVTRPNWTTTRQWFANRGGALASAANHADSLGLPLIVLDAGEGLRK
jgi:hypothetical protein